MTEETFTDEELSNLTDEEAAALRGEGDESESEADDAQADDDSTDADEGEEIDESADDEAEADAPAEDEPEAEADPEPVADEQAEDAEEPEPEPETAEQQEAEPPQALPDQLAAVDEAIDALGAKVEDGEIDFQEYNRELRQLNNQRQELVVDIRDARNAQVRRAEEWGNAVDTFMAQDAGHKAIVDNPLVKQAFETALQQVGQTAEGQRHNDAWRLNKAKEALVSAGFSLGGKAPAAPKAPPKSRKPDAKLPTTLGDLPAAEANDDNSEFSHLSQLDGMDLEEALAKLSPEQEQRYLGG